MGKQRAAEQSELKDYYLALRLHPTADAVMVDQAYWHLARLYSAARGTDPLAKDQLDALNEAYSVLGSPEQRLEYDQVRNAVLGEGTLPPEREATPPPLSVLSKVKPRQRQGPPQRRPRFSFSLSRLLPRKLPSLPTLSAPNLTMPTITSPEQAQPQLKPPTANAKDLQSSTEAIRARLRAATKDVADQPPPPDDQADPLL